MSRRPASAPVGGELIPTRDDPVTGCWLWIGALDGKGYAKASIEGRLVQMHIHLWTAKNGPLPRGIQLDHMCRRRRCIRPEHMDPVTTTENAKRTFARYRRTIEYCPAQHRLDEVGVPTPEGGMVCGLCSGIALPKGSSGFSPAHGDAVKGSAGVGSQDPEPNPVYDTNTSHGKQPTRGGP